MMFARKCLLGIGLATALAACSKDAPTVDKDVLVHNDFETLYGWVGETPSLTKEKAHSGLYSIKVDPNTEYSLTFRSLIGRLISAKPKKMKLEGWVLRASDESDARLTVQLLRPKDGSSVLSESVSLKEKIAKPGVWEKVEMEFAMPDQASSEDELRLYLWRVGSGEPVYLDDVELRAIE